MDGCRIGGAPQGSASAFLTYFASRGWVASCGVNYAGLRYVEPSFVRRTERVLRQGSASQEIYAQFLSQQRLDDAMTVDASVSRWFRVGQSRLSLTLSVRNLLNNCDIVYSGYESSRIRHYRSGANTIYAPQDDIITYAYPRTFYGVVSWKF
jgi:outer membrane receptor protein involved in Fe transport